MIERRTVFEIHRLAHEGYSCRKIARTLRISRQSVAQYLLDPDPCRASPKRPSKLDPFKNQIAQWLQTDPRASAVVLLQRLMQSGFDGGYTILKDHLRAVRPSQPQAFIRFESAPGEQCQIDWGHFGSIAYGDSVRKLYALAVIEAYSRMLYLEFTHSQRQETLHRCLLHAFRFFQGTPRDLVCDNMLTAVTEREGSLIRFNEAFLDFLRPFAITPQATNPAQPHEKGKVEKGAIHYIRHNFLPLRNFRDLADLQAQADQWRDQVANRRVHRTTGERPCERFSPQSLRPLPELLPDCRDTQPAKAYSDFSVHFDGNTYSVPPWAIGKPLTLKADSQTLTVYFKEKAIATHPRCWQRRQRIEHESHREEARKYHRRFWRSEEVAAFASLGEPARHYLDSIVRAQHPIKKSLRRLLALKEQYGVQDLLQAIERAVSHQAYGVEYVQNILYQQNRPQTPQPPVRVKAPQFNHIYLDQPLLAEYDAWVLKRKESSR